MRVPFSGHPAFAFLEIEIKGGLDKYTGFYLCSLGAWSTYQINASHAAPVMRLPVCIPHMYEIFVLEDTILAKRCVSLEVCKLAITCSFWKALEPPKAEVRLPFSLLLPRSSTVRLGNAPELP